MKNLETYLSIIVGLLGAFPGVEQAQAIAKWAALGIKAWQTYGDVSDEFKLIADGVQALREAGWKLDEVTADYEATAAELGEDFDILHGPGAQA